jgi:peptidoglycan/xylan/chitin deacetylase (PgdA/CDA1 family)
MAATFCRRPAVLDLARPIVSFTFDDAPRSAFEHGGAIVRAHAGRGTYFVSLGLLAKTSEIGPIADADHLAAAIDHGHELGCHTFDHLDAWCCSPSDYLASIDRNQQALDTLFPGYRFHSFAYPKNGATLAVKIPLSHRFASCRGGGQTFNAGRIDLNLLHACFLDRRAHADLDFARRLIELNAAARGWLIFAAHDITDDERPFACQPRLLEKVVQLACDSGAELIPMYEALRKIGAPSAAQLWTSLNNDQPAD